MYSDSQVLANNLSKYGLEKTSDKVEFFAYSDDYTNSVIFGRAIGGNYYCKSRFDGKWNTANLATKDDLGNFLVASGTKASVYKSDVDITSLKLYAGHTYLVLGNTNVDASVSLISSRIVGPTSDYGTVSALGQVRTTGSNGGGCMTASIISLTEDFTITLRGYGYDNSTYNYIGNLIAIQLK